jgi:hypothetical protein
MFDTMEEFYKAKYTEANDERFKYLRAVSQMTGYFSTLAIHDNTMPVKARVRMLERLIELWHELDPASEMTNKWTLEWQNKIKEISA